ncbi:protein kinase [bacterium]|nr:protein kinase [bacterium]
MAFSPPPPFQHVHQNRVIHCDMKGENVVIGASDASRSSWHAKVIEFALACKTGHRLVNPRIFYMATEHQVFGIAKSSLDLWGLGVVLWQLAVGKTIPNACTQTYNDIG